MIPSSTLLDVSDFFVPHRILTSPVSIHAPTWGATYANANNASSNSFQSTLPHGERQAVWSIAATTTRFNPRSHTGSDAQEVFHQQRGDVSIHAPAWGATGRRSLCRGHRSVSTHAPTRGATRTFEKPTKANLFQSTLPHGERRISVAVRTLCRRFNPRSHTGSDTSGNRTHQPRHRFNPRSHTGSDRRGRRDINERDVSIHAPTRGATDKA